MLRNLARAAAARTRPPAAMTRRRLSAKPPAKPTKAEPVPQKKMTREEVDALAAAAKAQQRLVDTESRLFGGGVGATHPFVLTLFAACVGLHFYNADLQTKRGRRRNCSSAPRAAAARPLSADELRPARAQAAAAGRAGAATRPTPRGCPRRSLASRPSGDV